MYFRKERRFTSAMKYRHFFSFFTLCLLANTVASAHNTVLTLRQDGIIPALHAQPLAQIR